MHIARMRASTWRGILLALCAAGMLFVAISFLDQLGIGGAQPWYGIWGGYYDGSPTPYHLTFRGVDPGGPGERGGLREGDRIDIRDRTAVQRLSMLGQPLAGVPLRLTLLRANEKGTLVQRSATIVPTTLNFARFWNYVVWEFANLWMLIFAALIAWRRPYVGNNLLLATVLAFAAVGFSTITLFYAFPWAWAYAAASVTGIAVGVSVVLWAALASTFARPLSASRRIALWSCCAFTAAVVLAGDGTTDRVIGLAPLVGMLTMWFDPTRFYSAALTIPIDMAVLCALAASVLAIASARGVERQRAAWVLVPFAIFYLAMESTTVAFHFLSYAMLLTLGQVYSVAALIAPVILTYAALNRRLIDIGFVLNRTVVFAILSTIVIGVFVVVEWAAGAWLVNASHTTSVIAGMVVALGLGFSLRYIHRYVDRFVDNVLFRKRHEDESALRRFAHESAYISDLQILLTRTVETVRTHTTAEFADVLVADAACSAFVPATRAGVTVSDDDAAIVALRAWNKPVALHAMDGTALHGDIAFPMVSRGRLTGVLVCGEKRDGETYAPDESDALLAIAHGVGGALDILESKTQRPSDPNLEEICGLLRALPDAIADRLRSVSP